MLLEMRDVSKSFGATRALERVSMTVDAGEVRALIGENGAGKSTLMKILSGAYRPDSGSMTLAGEPYSPRGPREALARGVAMIYQELALAPHLSVEANVLLGQERVRAGLIRRREHRRIVAEALELLEHPDIRPEAKVGDLGVGAQQLVEVARALVSQARAIVFDEPTSSLSERDAERLFAIIDRLRRRGLAIVYISHFLEEVRRVAETYTVLRDGRVVAAGRLAKTELPTIIGHMVGRDLDELFPRVPHEPGETILELLDVRSKGRRRPASLAVRRGEILGLAGLVGAGRTRLVRAVFGLQPVVAGTIRVAHVAGGYATPRRRIAQGVGFLSEDRKGEGLAMGLSIEDNMTYPGLRRHARRGWLRLKERRAEVGLMDDSAADRGDRPAPACQQPLGRQPAESRPGTAPPPAGRYPPPRRADTRHRRRLQGRDLSPPGRARRTRQGDPRRQLLSSRALRYLRSDRRHVARHLERGPAGRPMDRAPGHGSGHPGLLSCSSVASCE